MNSCLFYFTAFATSSLIKADNLGDCDVDVVWEYLWKGLKLSTKEAFIEESFVIEK